MTLHSLLNIPVTLVILAIIFVVGCCFAKLFCIITDHTSKYSGCEDKEYSNWNKYFKGELDVTDKERD